MTTADPTAAAARRRWIARPPLFFMIVVCWLLLQQSLALPQLIAASLLGVLLPAMIDGFLGPTPRPARPWVALRLFATVIRDVIESNLTVARIVLTPWSDPQPGWLRVPMDIRHPIAQTLLASIITNTPGTVSCKIDEDSNELTVHVLDCGDPAALVAQIKQRYERPLQEILG